MCFRAKNASYGYKACLCIPSRCFRVDSSTCSRTRSSQPLPPCHINPTWWLRIGRLHTKQIAVMVLKKGSARSRLKPARKAWRPLAATRERGREELSTEEEGASFNDKITWNQAMPTERLKVIICRSRGFSANTLKIAIAHVVRSSVIFFLCQADPRSGRKRHAGYWYIQMRAYSRFTAYRCETTLRLRPLREYDRKNLTRYSR